MGGGVNPLSEPAETVGLDDKARAVDPMRAYLQLLRLPNVFTAMADILLGFLFTHEGLNPGGTFALLLGTSTCLYLAGMVLNDYFDREQDARERPSRPIPFGRIRAATAWRLGVALWVLGIGLGGGASLAAGDIRPAVVAALLAVAVVAYDAILKRTPAGPLAMGACRTLNVLLGMSAASAGWQAVNWVAAGGIGLYVVGVTIFARGEARDSSRLRLTLGLAVVVAGIAMLGSLPEWATGNERPVVRAPPQWNLFWVAIGALMALRLARAIVEPRPEQVQAAVRHSIFTLVILDAATCLAVQEPKWGLLILALLVPTMTLGRWIYST